MKITFYHPFGLKFNGYSIYSPEGLGGSETSIIYSAFYFMKKGYEVDVYCVCDKPGNYYGIEFKNHDDINLEESRDIFISIRNSQIFSEKINSKMNILWLHDFCVDNKENSPIVKNLKNIDKIFAVSEWQKNEYINRLGLTEKKFVVVRNGVNPGFFKEPIKRKKNKVTYSTKYFKGIELTEKVIKRLVENFPELEIHIFGYKSPWDDDFQYDGLKQIPNIIIRDSVSQNQLAKEMQEAYIHIHPNSYPETSCITAYEAQMAGTPIISTYLAALPETVINKKSGILIKEDYNSEEYVDKFIKAFGIIYNNKKVWEFLSENGKKNGFENTWEHVVERAENSIKQHFKQSDTTIVFLLKDKIEYLHQIINCVKTIRYYSNLPIKVYYDNLSDNEISRYNNIEDLSFEKVKMDYPYFFYYKPWSILKTQGDVLYLDSDIECINDFSEMIKSKKVYLNFKEKNYYGWQEHHKKLFDTINWQIWDYNIKKESTFLWNAGVIYVPKEKKHLIKKSLHLIDCIVNKKTHPLVNPSFPNNLRNDYLLEQFVLSIVLQKEDNLKSSSKYFWHYLNQKQDLNSEYNKKVQFTIMDYYQPEITIMMPTFNHAQYIREAIESVINQTYPHWELIIVDDGSTDDTEKVVNSFSDTRIRYLKNLQNIGISKSRNRAIRFAKGKYIGHLDSDDLLIESALEKCKNIFDSNNKIKMVYTNFEHVNKDNNQRLGIHNGVTFIKKNLHNNPIWSHFGIYEKNAALSVGGFDENLTTCEDGHLYLKLGEKFELFHLDEILYKRRIHDSNVMFNILKDGCNGCKVRTNCPSYHVINRLRTKYERLTLQEKELDSPKHF